ncbi:CDP-glycerol glycerophosphotransferase [Herbinix hemicellulosilytica]|uniref:CDP-glycerol:poly(Glycerophosphate)glycerophosphotransferase n=1 Tax=Herbinix hemicellulosilytica TaxID=1564487 RepID=A0A0H5SD45_HERHM|nr:CDP-glycerol glycerophosphotransferase family protein [Herbinix hemicellulosilytica]RBP57823.1 CDP-glycerol glycerophosphotransferase [Herbinix hemicellulosilytica]CRZ33344.1 CDP-glycerol:poly(glycerophosphate)glycerophosphotransferase [Herbinix hemicellulosilytica]
MALIKQMVLAFYKVLTRILPINKKIILFESNLGRNYTGNPKAIYEEMIRRGLDKKYRCYFILEDMQTEIPGAAKKIKRNRFRYFFYFAIAGTWISDSRFPKYIIKRKGCTYIQTWHGTPLKKLALDMDAVYMAGETDINEYKKNFYENAQTWDYLISQNSYSTQIFKRAFGFNKEILEIGYPRNDILFHKNNKNDIEKLKEMLGLPKDKRIILYAPTWRDNEFYGNGRYKFNPRIDFSLLMKELKEDTVMIVKYHYLVMDQIDWSPYRGFIYTYDMSYDISMLYLVSDMLITDYSSVMFDYSILKRPMLFYCYDLEEYKNTLRGFYFDFINDAPGPVVETTEELIKAVKVYDYDLYKEKYEAFCRKFNHADDGKASKKVVDLILKTAPLK